MAEQTLSELIQSVGRSMSRANSGLGGDGNGRQYAVSELTVSSPLSRLSVDDDVVVDTEPGDEEEEAAGNLEFTMVPLPPEESSETRQVPEVEEQPVAQAVKTLLKQGYSVENIQLSFDPEADAEAGTISSYQLREQGGVRPSAVQLTVAGEPPEELQLGAIGRTATEGVSTAEDRTYRRRRRDSDTWHFCRNCSNDPEEDYLTREEEPSSGELCNECQAKERQGDCQ